MCRNEAGDCKWRAFDAETGVYTLNGEKGRVGVAADNRECAPEVSTGVGW